MAFGGMIRTTKGRNLLAQAEMSKQLNITHVAIGDGFYTGSYNSITALSHQLFTVPVKKTVRENSDELVVEVDISESGLTESYYLRELGIFAQDDQSAVLYAYDNAGTDAELIPAAGGAVSVANRMRFILKISDAINVTVNTADAIYVTPEELSEKLQTYTTYPISYQGNPVIIPNTKAGDYLLPSTKGYTKITKPNTNADISPDNIATLQGVANPVFTASDGKGNSNTAALQAELYSLPNGICDEYDGVSDKLIKNIINRELDGNENWLLESNYSSTDYPCFYASTKGDNCIDNSFVLCTHLKYNANFAVLNTDIGIAIKNNGNNVIKIYVKVNKEIASTSPEFSSWIRNQKLVGKPVKLSYQLATPTITYPNINLTAYNGTTTVSCNDTVLQDMSVTLADSRKVYNAVNADMLGDKPPAWYVQSNPNLLINAHFPIWQRGTNFDITPLIITYTSDRWAFYYGAGTCNVSKDTKGLKIINSTLCQLLYFMEQSEFDKLKDEKVTLSKSINGVVTQETYVLSEFPFGDTRVLQISFGAGTHIVNWVKLELGDHATPFVPRLYGEELSLCQRYYEEISAVLYMASSSNFGVSVPYKSTKRIAGTTKIISFNGTENSTSYNDGVNWIDVPVGQKIDYPESVYINAFNAAFNGYLVGFKVISDAEL